MGSCYQPESPSLSLVDTCTRDRVLEDKGLSSVIGSYLSLKDIWTMTQVWPILNKHCLLGKVVIPRLRKAFAGVVMDNVEPGVCLFTGNALMQWCLVQHWENELFTASDSRLCETQPPFHPKPCTQVELLVRPGHTIWYDSNAVVSPKVVTVESREVGRNYLSPTISSEFDFWEETSDADYGNLMNKRDGYDVLKWIVLKLTRPHSTCDLAELSEARILSCEGCWFDGRTLHIPKPWDFFQGTTHHLCNKVDVLSFEEWGRALVPPATCCERLDQRLFHFDNTDFCCEQASKSYYSGWKMYGACLTCMELMAGRERDEQYRLEEEYCGPRPFAMTNQEWNEYLSDVRESALASLSGPGEYLPWWPNYDPHTMFELPRLNGWRVWPPPHLVGPGHDVELRAFQSLSAGIIQGTGEDEDGDGE